MRDGLGSISNVVASHEGHEELVLLAELAGTNHEVARYISRVLDVDRGLTEFSTPLVDVEITLAERLIAAGNALHDHASRRVTSS